jgi:hypothetical protein
MRSGIGFARGPPADARSRYRGGAAEHEIFVALLDESVDVWRPVLADRLAEDTYRIAAQPYDRAAEVWEFKPGDIVRCAVRRDGDGPILVAATLADGVV